MNMRHSGTFCKTVHGPFPIVHGSCAKMEATMLFFNSKLKKGKIVHGPFPIVHGPCAKKEAKMWFVRNWVAQNCGQYIKHECKSIPTRQA